MTAAALRLDGRTSHRAVRAKNAAVPRLRFKQCFTARALVKILARVRRHDFFTLLPANRASEHGLQDDGAHGFAIAAKALAHNCLVAVCMGCSLHRVLRYGVNYD
jgi:hypothetical protein